MSICIRHKHPNLYSSGGGAHLYCTVVFQRSGLSQTPKPRPKPSSTIRPGEIPVLCTAHATHFFFSKSAFVTRGVGLVWVANRMNRNRRVAGPPALTVTVSRSVILLLQWGSWRLGLLQVMTLAPHAELRAPFIIHDIS